MKHNFFFPQLILILIGSTLTFNAIAQEKEISKLANNFFEKENFIYALPEYLKLLEIDSTNLTYNYRVGVCYLNTNIDKTKSINYLEKVVQFEKSNPTALYLLGRAYHFAYRFNDAVAMYQKFRAVNKGNVIEIEDVEKQIEYCYNAFEIMKFKLDVTFKNLGQHINSSGPDYYPFVPSNESFIMFNSKRNEGSDISKAGNYFSKVYFSKTLNGEFTEAVKLNQNINTIEGTEEVVGLSPDGRFILFYFENETHDGDLYIAEFGNDSIISIEKFPKEINSSFHEIAATISSSGDEIYFASDREGGYGGVDIYVTRKLPNGKWGLAQNLGPSINTKFDEDFPNISTDGETLFFSSKGHTSMGGYDIFKASWDNVKRTWTTIKNIGYPINTPEDNMNYRESKTGRTGYISALRAGGFGDLDIYSVVFNEVDPEYTVINGNVINEKTKEILTEVNISVLDLQTDQEYGTYLTNPHTGRFIIILPPGKFNILVEIPGYKTYTEDITINGKDAFKSVISKNIKVEKKE